MLKVTVKGPGNARKKIMDILKKNDVDILVGFPSGREHVPTLHKDGKGKNAKYVGYNGEDPLDIQPIETAELAKMLSYGSESIPARPFLTEGIDSKLKDIKDAMEHEAAKIIKGQAPNWEKIGSMAAGAVQEFVRGDHYRDTKPNSARTIKHKGSDKPLIDGGDLIGSLTFLVKEKK